MQLYPLFKVAIFIVIGVAIAYNYSSAIHLYVWLALFFTSVIFYAFLGKHFMLKSISIAFAALFAGAFALSLQERKNELQLTDKIESYNAVVIGSPIEKGKVIKCDLLIVNSKLKDRKIKANILKDTITNNYKRLKIGSKITFYSSLNEVKNYNKSNFNYALYLKNRGFVGQTFIHYNAWKQGFFDIKNISVVDKLMILSGQIREKILYELRQLPINDEALGVSVAMLLGEKQFISKNIKDLYSQSGAAHVLAISGLHISIIWSLLLILLPFKRYKVAKQVIILSFIWAYAFISGLSYSVLRATVMMTIYSLVTIKGGEKISINTLGFAICVIILFNPLSLFDVGLQLSFVAVLFILLLYKSIYTLIPIHITRKYKTIKYFWSITSVSIAAQLGVAPLIAFYFGTFSTCFLLSNFVVIPLATVIIVLVFICIILLIISIQPTIIIDLLNNLIVFQNTMLQKIISIPYSVISQIRINTIQLLLVYIMILCVFLCVIQLKKKGFTEKI